MPARKEITLGILAGGRGSRLGGIDKALMELAGQSLLSRTMTALGSGFARTLISYNGTDARVLAIGASCIADQRDHFPGPLAGIESLLAAAATDWLLTVPVDLRDIPPELPEALSAELDGCVAGIGSVIRDADGLQPLVALWPVAASRPAVTAALDSGNGAAHQLLQSMHFRIFDISPLRLGNLNTHADFG